MSLPTSDCVTFSSSPRDMRGDQEASSSRREDSVHRRSPTLVRSFDFDAGDVRERQRAMDVDSAMQLSRSRSATIPIPPRSSNPSHILPTITSTHSSPQRSSLEIIQPAFPMLSESEELEMRLARGGVVDGGDNYPYNETEPISPHLGILHGNSGALGDESDGPRHHDSLSTSYNRDIHLNHHDPMLVDILNPPDSMLARYSPHDPVIGSLDSRDPVAVGSHQHQHDFQSAHDPSHPHSSSIPMPQAGNHVRSDQNQRPISQADMIMQTSLPPMYLPEYRSTFDYSIMDSFAAEQRERRAQYAPTGLGGHESSEIGAAIRRRLAQTGILPKETGEDRLDVLSKIRDPMDRDFLANGRDGILIDASVPVGLDTHFNQHRQRKLSQSNPNPRRQAKLAMFEGGLGGSGSSSHPRPSSPNGGRGTNGRSAGVHRSMTTDSGHDRPYRFSFYSNAMSQTIHARSFSELPAEGQTFEDLFLGRSGLEKGPGSEPGTTKKASGASGPNSTRTTPTSTVGRTPSAGTPGPTTVSDANTNKHASHSKENVPGRSTSRSNIFGNVNGNGTAPQSGIPGDVQDDYERSTWWLDILSPTDEEMRMLSKVFSIHPLTTEDIQMEETREKIELFRNYYFVCFRGFDQDVYSPTHLEPLNMYIIVFREGTLSFHFRGTPHPQNVRRRIKQLKDYINVTADWISYALIDDITDAFGPLIQNIEYEVDSIDELVLILKDAEQTDMLRRIGTCRKKVMGLLRLMGNKADVVKGLAKRCNENWSVAPKSDIGLYLSDIQDHLVTMTQNLNHYEKILSRSHSNYLAQISIEMTDANNQINDVLSKLTALGTVLVPMNLITGLWGMNVHVPGQDITEGYVWFCSIIGVLVAVACAGFMLTYKLMVSR